MNYSHFCITYKCNTSYKIHNSLSNVLISNISDIYSNNKPFFNRRSYKMTVAKRPQYFNFNLVFWLMNL